VILFSQFFLESKKILLVAFSQHYNSSEIFFPQSEILAILKRAASNAGCVLDVADDCPYNGADYDAIVFINSEKKKNIKNTKIKRILYLWEPYDHPDAVSNYIKNNYDIIFTWADDKVDGKKYHKFLYAQGTDFSKNILEIHKPRFCSIWSAGFKTLDNPLELYSARIKTLDYFYKMDPNKVDVYGTGWDKNKYSTYKGYVSDKLDRLKEYKFCICYENMRDLKGYVSEKILHSFFARSVPLYWGSSNVTNYIPANCFIDRKMFSSEAELYSFLTSMSDEDYYTYQANIQNFLESDNYLLFSPIYFCELLLKVIIPKFTREVCFNADEIIVLEKIDKIKKSWKE
jgi:hypothetical protein